VTGFLKHGHEILGSIKCGEFLDQLRNWWRLKKHSDQAPVTQTSLRCEQFSSRWIAQHPAVSIRTGKEVKENHEPPRPAGRTLRTLRTRSVTGTKPQATLVKPQFVTGTLVTTAAKCTK